MARWCKAIALLSAVAAAFQPGVVPAQPAGDPLEQLRREFKDPPASARPRTWWHWTNSNVTRDGITKDLEWMARVGIAGFQLADVAFGGGPAVEEPLAFGSPGWLDAVGHATAEAKRLGLEMTVFSSPGWSMTGGPWVAPEMAMKKLVWSEVRVTGPATFGERLPRPPDNNGPIRNLGGAGTDPTHYGDSAVIAFRTPPVERAAPPRPTVTSSGGEVNADALLDDNLNSAADIAPAQPGTPAWLQYEYAGPFTARALTIAGPSGIPIGRVLAGDSEDDLRPVLALPGAQLYRQERVRTFALPEVTARIFRIELTAAPLGPAETMSQQPTAPAQSYRLSEAIFHGGARVHRWEEKAGFSFLFEYESVPTPPVATEATIDRVTVIDLTDRMREDGTLDWEVPEGDWTILRLGYSLTGAKNRPATPTGSGYEVDKLSAEHTRAYYEAFSGLLKEAMGDLYGDSLQYFLIDSWEAGMQNWTGKMIAEFAARRGYDPTPWLPVLTGRVIESADASDRFLWDFRRTLADMFAENHYAVLDELLAREGMGTYAEAAGVSLEIPEDTLLNKSRVDIPMGEFWMRDLHPRLMYLQDVRGAASAAHAYGKRLVGAESFTGGGYESPYAMKQVGDYWLAQGINRIVFHTSAHQPFDSKPGNTMVGTHVHRNITWAEQARPFMDYLARDCHMLQQGLFVADLAYLLAEGAPSTMPIWGAGTQPAPPAGYDHDFINTDVLLNRMSCGPGGGLVLPDGMSYRLLVLPDSEAMRPEVLRRLHELVLAGATILGPPPRRSPSLAGWPQSDDEVRALALELWGDLDGRSRTTRRVGRGRVVWGLSPEQVLADLGVRPDFEAAGGLDLDLVWLHRRTDEADIYFVANIGDHAQSVQARLRVAGRAAEIWHPETGRIEPASYWIDGETTTVPLQLDAHEAVFVVMSGAAEQSVRIVPEPQRRQVAVIDGAWELAFPPDLGAPAAVRLASLRPWTAYDEPGIRYFSGTATYGATFNVEAAWLGGGRRLLLDLGRVDDLAEVRVNAQPVGILWKPPFRVDVTQAVRAGENRLEVAVTNQWTNRMTGDGVVPPEQRVLDAGGRGGGSGVGGPRMGAGGAAPRVATSGLSGPVTLHVETPAEHPAYR